MAIWQERYVRAGRPAWHTRPLGQTLIVTNGCGWAQCDRGPVKEIRPDDVVWFPPGEKHWHGASATTAMTHIAIQEKLAEVLDANATPRLSVGVLHSLFGSREPQNHANHPSFAVAHS